MQFTEQCAVNARIYDEGVGSAICHGILIGCFDAHSLVQFYHDTKLIEGQPDNDIVP